MTIRKTFESLQRSRQRGVTTLAVTLILLVALTLIVILSTNVAFFEQRTTTNENRAQITEQMAEYAINLSGEYLKANRSDIINNVGSGWFASGSTRRWQRCPTGTLATTHPCSSERDVTRRAQMYYYDNDPNTAEIEGLPYSTITGAATGALTGETQTSTTRFAGTTAVNAVLCRIEYDLTDPTNPIPSCAAVPTSGYDLAVTLIADVQLSGESSASTIKETWATVSTRNPSAAVPLIAAGFVEGLGNAQIVAAPNAGGYGVAASIWSPNNVDIGNSGGSGCGGGGIGSVSTCHLGEFLQTTPRDQLKTTCASSNNACGCPSVSASGVDFLSGHSQSTRLERYDILDRDSNCGSPDIQFFPKQPYDKANDPTDDSLFEFIFGVDYVVDEGATTVNTNCGTSGTQNCAAFALTEEYSATVLSSCASLGTASQGVFYVTGDCDLHDIGSATNSVIVVVDGNISINGNVDFFGMLFARSNNNSAEVRGNGNVKIFGSLVVEGDVDINGGIDLIYDNAAASACEGSYCPIPQNVRFGKVTGSWLDSRVGI